MRYYLVPVAGDGSGENPYRPALPEGVTSWATLLPCDERGTPKQAWSVCLVDGDHDALAKDSSVIQFLPVDAAMSAIPASQRTAYQNAIRQTGYDVPISWQRDTAADVVDKMAVFAEPSWKRGGMAIERDVVTGSDPGRGGN